MHAFVVPLQISSIREFGEAVCAGIHFAKIKQFNFSEALRYWKLSKWGVNNNADKVGELVEVCLKGAADYFKRPYTDLHRLLTNIICDARSYKN